MVPFLSDRVALVTGASRGLGAGTAKMLARAGATVVLTARDQATLDVVADDIRAEGGKVAACAAELADDSAVRQMVEQTVDAFGRIDFLLSIGGSADGIGTDLDSVAPDVWARLWEANVTGPLNLVRHILPVMRQQQAGRLFFLSSSATFRPMFNTGAYGATKAAVNHLVQSIAAQPNYGGITACAFNPGPIDTPVFAQVSAALWQGQTSDATRSPETAARLLLWLCSAETEGLTGEFVQWNSPNTMAAVGAFLQRYQIRQDD